MVIIWIGVVVIVVFIFIFVYGVFNVYSLVVRKYEVYILKKVEGCKSLCIVMVFDMYFGKLFGVLYLKRFVCYVNEMEFDIILLLGDIIDDYLGVFI